jgi:peptidoglycan/LPS O-acetylase OafA/YrhL
MSRAIVGEASAMLSENSAAVCDSHWAWISGLLKPGAACTVFRGSQTVNLLVDGVHDLSGRSSMLRRISLHFGRISYPIYLFHLPLLMILLQWASSVSPGIEFAAYLSLMIVFCSLFNAVFERPILAARPRYDTDVAERGRAEVQLLKVAKGLT